MRPYIVRQGDYLTKIAAVEGFDAAEVWAAPANEDLARARATPNALCPGDVLYVPDVPPSGHGVSLQQDNPLRGEAPRVSIRLRLVADEPTAGEEFVVRCGDAEAGRGIVDAEGVASFPLSTQAREAVVELPRRGVLFPIVVGGLDCARTDTGAAMRLANLGYGARATSAPMVPPGGGQCPFATGEADGPAPDPAVEAFQRDVGLRVTGRVDEETRRRIAEAHGS